MRRETGVLTPVQAIESTLALATEGRFLPVLPENPVSRSSSSARLSLRVPHPLRVFALAAWVGDLDPRITAAVKDALTSASNATAARAHCQAVAVNCWYWTKPSRSSECPGHLHLCSPPRSFVAIPGKPGSFGDELRRAIERFATPRIGPWANSLP